MHKNHIKHSSIVIWKRGDYIIVEN